MKKKIIAIVLSVALVITSLGCDTGMVVYASEISQDVENETHTTEEATTEEATTEEFEIMLLNEEAEEYETSKVIASFKWSAQDLLSATAGNEIEGLSLNDTWTEGNDTAGEVLGFSASYAKPRWK